MARSIITTMLGLTTLSERRKTREQRERLRDVFSTVYAAVESDGGFGEAVETWVSEYGRVVPPAAMIVLEDVLHRYLCIPQGNCRCMSREES